MPQVFITGGAGFIGCALATQLCATGEYDVVAMDNLHPQVHPTGGRPADLPPAARLLRLDVTAGDAWDVALSELQPDIVVHLAAETGTGQSLSEASRHALVNVVGTTRLLDALSHRGLLPSQLLLASSRAVYGEGAWASATGGEPLLPQIRSHAELSAGRWAPTAADGNQLHPLPHRADRVPARPASVYAATKLAQENILTSWAAATGTPLSILRLQNVYGPGQSLTNAYTGIVTYFANLASRGEQIQVYEDGGIVRDFVYIDDVARAFVTAIERPPDTRRLLDIGSGHPLTILGLARTIADLYQAPTPTITGAFRDGDVRAAYADVEPARQELGWAPRQQLADGLRALFARVATG